MINFLESGNILYISSVDLSIGNGPGVNEREFTLGLYSAIKERAHFLVPKPAEKFDDLPEHVCTYSYPHHGHHPLHYPVHSLSTFFLANRLLKQRKYDLIVYRLDILPFAPLLIAWKHQVPYVLKTLGQGMMNVLYEKGGLIGRLLARPNQIITKRLVDLALMADSVSVAQVDFLEQKLGVNSQKIVWVDNAVNTDRFFPSNQKSTREKLNLSHFDPIVGYAGGLPWERGGMQIVEAAPYLLSKFPKLGVVVVGGGSQLDSIKLKARELGIEDHCVFTGYVPFEMIPLYVNSFDVCVSISLRPDRFAASELKVRQYLACGKPVILSPGSNDFVVEEKLGTIIPPDDPESINMALDHWLSLTPDERSGFSARAAEFVQKNLSITASIDTRFRMWSERLQA